MNRDDIIRMAREAGSVIVDPNAVPIVMRFAALVAAAEREACAKVCEDIEMRNTRQGPADCAVAIRARGQE